MARFSAPINKIGINPVVDPPDEVTKSILTESGRTTGPIPVRGRINDADFIQTLVKFRGAWRLYINGPMLKNSALAVGDMANIEIEFDPRPRDVPVPDALAAAFRKNSSAKAAFDQLTPSRQKDILKYIGSLKSADAVRKNVDRVICRLQDDP